MSEKEKITLRREGDLPLRFAGEMIGEFSSAASERTRWYEIRVYDVDAPACPSQFAISIIYRSTWQGERDHHSAYLAENEASGGDIILSYDPLEPVVGFPSGDHFAERQIRLERSLRADYDRLVSDVFSAVDWAADL